MILASRTSAAAALLAAVLMMSACSSEPSDEDFDAAYEQSQDELSEASFEDVGDSAECTVDCSGHEAGFEWAKEEGVTDSSECGGKSDSFIEGCEAYAEALDEGAGEALESEY